MTTTGLSSSFIVCVMYTYRYRYRSMYIYVCVIWSEQLLVDTVLKAFYSFAFVLPGSKMMESMLQLCPRPVYGTPFFIHFFTSFLEETGKVGEFGWFDSILTK